MSKISAKEKKNYRIVSRIVGIFFRIANVIGWVGVVVLGLVTIACAAISPNFKVNADSKEISFFDKTQKYDIRGGVFEIGEDNEKITIDNGEIKIGKDANVTVLKLSESDIAEIETFIERDLTRLIAVLPFVCLLAMIAAVFNVLAVGHAARIFKNIAKKDTPFIKDNIDRGEKAIKYLVIALVISILADIIVSTVVRATSGLTITCSSLGTIFVAYVAIYVLKSGYALEEGTKTEKTTEKDKE